MVKQYFTSQSSVSILSNPLYLILDMIILYTIKCPSDQQYLRLYLKDHTEVTRFFFQGGGNPTWCKGTRNKLKKKKEKDKVLLQIPPCVLMGQRFPDTSKIGLPTSTFSPHVVGLLPCRGAL